MLASLVKCSSDLYLYIVYLNLVHLEMYENDLSITCR